jgi:transcriptional regulator with XRE-family HTH domain
MAGRGHPIRAKVQTPFTLWLEGWARDHGDLSQQDLARLTDIPPTTINSWLRSGRDVTPVNLKKLADGTGTDYVYLLALAGDAGPRSLPAPAGFEDIPLVKRPLIERIARLPVDVLSAFLAMIEAQQAQDRAALTPQGDEQTAPSSPTDPQALSGGEG